MGCHLGTNAGATFRSGPGARGTAQSFGQSGGREGACLTQLTSTSAAPEATSCHGPDPPGSGPGAKTRTCGSTRRQAAEAWALSGGQVAATGGRVAFAPCRHRSRWRQARPRLPPAQLALHPRRRRRARGSRRPPRQPGGSGCLRPRQGPTAAPCGRLSSSRCFALQATRREVAEFDSPMGERRSPRGRTSVKEGDPPHS